MRMLPNYILVVLFTFFLINSFIKVRRARVGNGLILGIGVVLAIILLIMSIYGIIHNMPLQDVQVLVENYFK